MKAQTKRVDRLAQTSYASLNGTERLRVLVQHAAAGNEQEAGRVVDATPAGPYTEADPEFTEAFRALWHLSRDMDAAVTSARVDLELLQYLRHGLSLALPVAVGDMHRVGGSAHPPPREKSTLNYQAAQRCFNAFRVAGHPMEEVLHEGLYVPTLKRLWWSWRAFDQCCRQRLGLEGGTAFKAYAGPGRLKFVEGVVAELRTLGLDKLQEEDTKGIAAIRAQFDNLFRFVPEEDDR